MKPLILSFIAIGLTAQVATPPQTKFYLYAMAPGATTWSPVGPLIVDQATITHAADGSYHLGTACPLAPIINRSTCVGSGPTWNCAGLQMITVTLPDGTTRAVVGTVPDA